jgi:hypothetical protein
MKTKSNFSEIERILSHTHRSANVAKIGITKNKLISAYRLPDFSEMDARDSDNLSRRILNLKLGFEPRFVIQVDEGLILFDENQEIKGYTYDFGADELFNEFSVEGEDSPSHTVDHIIEMQKMMNQHFRRQDE